METMHHAMRLSDWFKGQTHRLRAELSDHGVTGAKLQKVFGLLKNKGSKGATAREIMRATHMTKDQVQPLLEVLSTNGAIISNDERKTNRYHTMVDALPVNSWR